MAPRIQTFVLWKIGTRQTAAAALTLAAALLVMPALVLRGEPLYQGGTGGPEEDQAALPLDQAARAVGAKDKGRAVRLELEDGTVEEKPLPVVLMASRGGRFSMTRPQYPNNYFNGNGPLALYLIARGYVYVTVEMRGCGASFGVNDSFASHENRLDVEAAIRVIYAPKGFGTRAYREFEIV